MLIRRFLAVIGITWMLWGISAWGQAVPPVEEAPPPAAAPIAPSPIAAVSDVAAETPRDQTPTATPTFDLGDPAVQAALEARRAADEALLAAIRDQAASAQETETSKAPTSDAPKKPSLIPSNGEEVKALAAKIGGIILGWLTSIPFLAQVGTVILAYMLSPLLAKKLRGKVFLFRDKPTETTKLRVVREYVYRVGPLLRPILLVLILVIGVAVLKAVPITANDTWLVKIAQSLAVVFLLYKAIKEFIPNDLIRKLATWTIIPLALIMVFGYFDDLIDALNSVELMKMGDTAITPITIALLGIFGAIFFKLGNVANAKGQTAIRSQEGLDVATQEVVAKIFQMVLFTVIFILVLSAAKVPLSGLVVIFSALSLGIGLGLQPIAANFVSGMIILFDRSVRAGDYVVLPDGQEGFVEAINMRQTIVETTDGKDIMVPNTKFTEDAYENWTHKDPRQRYEVHFTVAYNTDLDALEGLIMPAFLNHPLVLKEPEMPDLEFREFGEHGAKMAVEFWCSGIDDGPNKFTSDLNFTVWRILRDNKIEIPFPQLVVHKK